MKLSIDGETEGEGILLLVLTDTLTREQRWSPRASRPFDLAPTKRIPTQTAT